MGMYDVRLFCPVCEAWRTTRESRKNIPNPVRPCSAHRHHGRVFDYKTTLDANGYERRRRNGKAEYVHRIVWEEAHGPIPAGYHVHHINHVRNDNRLENLELVHGSRHNRDHTTKRHAGGEIKVRGPESQVWRADIEDDYIARRYQEGASLRQIGREVSASHNVISTHLRALGLRS